MYKNRYLRKLSDTGWASPYFLSLLRGKGLKMANALQKQMKFPFMPKRGRPRRIFTEDDRAMVDKMLREKSRVSDIAAALGCDEKTARAAFRTHHAWPSPGTRRTT